MRGKHNKEKTNKGGKNDRAMTKQNQKEEMLRNKQNQKENSRRLKMKTVTKEVNSRQERKIETKGTDVNESEMDMTSKKEKEIKEMKGNKDIVLVQDTYEFNGLMYDKRTRSSVNGIVKNYHESGELYSETPYLEGKKDGLWRH